MLHPKAQEREDVVKARLEWRKKQRDIVVKNTYFLDESSVNCGMTRLYGRAFSNKRVNDYVPDVRFERTSVMGALGLSGVLAPLTYKGTLNGLLFADYVEKFLAPAMKKVDILILDNCSVHKVKNVLQPLIEKGVNIVFLPPFSPDFNPIELAWPKMKSYLRKVKPRTHTKLLDAVADALSLLTQNDIKAWITHCAYGL